MAISISEPSQRLTAQPFNQFKTTSVATNTLIITSLPSAFYHPSFQTSLRAHFASYGPLAAWISLASLGRILVVYHATSSSDDGSISARRARREMDRFVIEAGEGKARLADEEPGVGRPADELDPQTVAEKELEELVRNLPKTIFRIYFGPSTPTTPSAPITIYPKPDGSQGISTLSDDCKLKPPVSDKNFLISPPGSPPVGWEQIEEDAPNTASLAEDLCQRLRFLSVGENEDGEDEEESEDQESKEHDIVIIAPSPSSLLPTLKVQQSGSRGERPGMAIGMVKATIDSMLGGQKTDRITPTARPALA
ncbi:Calcipressin-domain-containing protein [Melampsora americana]|nr:Calcipressin-domain-containing protein [Melampsora americana]